MKKMRAIVEKGRSGVPRPLFLILMTIFLLTGCLVNTAGSVQEVESYHQIDQDMAKQMMTRDDGHVIVDARRQDEYDAGHIPGAILIPNESIEAERPEELPDLDQIILIYCRSGNRSKQAAQKLADMGYTNIYEFGAGTGHLAATLLKSLSDDLKHYYIIELSPELAERQHQFIAEHTTPQLAQKVIHLTELPESFDGIIIGNEVLDAMPVEIIRRTQYTFQHIGVSINSDGQLEHSPQLLNQPDLLRLAATYFPETAPPYTSELHPAQYAFILTLAQKITRGGMIFIDYGFDADQYYHPQRDEGTLIAHYRHHTIHDPFFHIGLTDLTAHVNFTDIAQAGIDGGLDLIGYLPQSYFLLNLGITNLLAQIGSPDSVEYIQAAAAVQKLIHQHEMGELFKVIAFGKDIDIDWTGFSHGDICHKL